MWKACIKGEKPRLVSIIRAGANLDEGNVAFFVLNTIVNEYGQTPLFVASFYGHLSIVKLLIRFSEFVKANN